MGSLYNIYETKCTNDEWIKFCNMPQVHAHETPREQHAKYIEFFYNGDPKNFIKQQERDQLKKELCEEN
ncbi:hypothetical protein Glove_575g26 [Diversispora epigaea]|uniref:Uncharacterized protein n=1 Tax=Diversispora epigaea TaxID=1348612 RepID=A0A397GDZ8_9GLOM|nr:hypothetical protein Glove_575g26 [Diversispora epigaea]